MPKLFVRLRSPAVAPGEDEGWAVAGDWMIQEDDGRIRARGDADFRGFSELIDPSTDWVRNPANVIVLVPAEHVLCLSVEVPGRSIGQVRRALPFAVEEFVTTDIEAMHLASGELKRGAPTRVNLLERTLLDDWLACLAAMRIRPGYLFSESELLPDVPDQASLLVDGDRVLLRTSSQAAAVDRDNVVLAVGALGVSRAVLAFGELTDLERGQLSQEVALETADTDAATPLEYFAAHWRTADAVNLLQGEYRSKQPGNPVWERWRPAAAVAAVWAVVALVAMIAEAGYASYKAEQLEARSEALYREIFPGERRVTNPRRQLQAKLGETTDADAGLLAFLEPLAASVGTSGARIASFNYDADRGELAVDMFTSGFDSLERIKESLTAAGMKVDITSAEQLDNGVRVRVRLHATGAAA